MKITSRGKATKLFWRRVLRYLADLAAFACAVVLAFGLRFDGSIPSWQLHGLLMGLCVWVSAKAVAFWAAGATRGSWQYTSIFDAMRIAIANTAGSVAGGVILYLIVTKPALPRSIYVLDWLLSLLLALGVRLLWRLWMLLRSSKRRTGSCKRVLIYGAGAAGILLLKEIRQNQSLHYDLMGFIDDDPSKAGLGVGGKPILGTGDDLARIVRQREIDQVLIAIPSASGADMLRILRLAQEANVKFKTVPGIGSLIQGAELGKQIRDVAVEDLLGRGCVELDLEGIHARIQGKVVMVTGAAGSIGSELCRQIALFGPRALIGFDQAETPLFHLERAMANQFPELTFYPEIGSITNLETVRRVMRHYQPEIVYHAAAYKHVGMMEMHAFAAIETNVFGTWNVARAAAQTGVRDFVMISTDKAVRPTSVMGASKRLAELVIRASQEGENATNFVSVRFGNVLGSNGSVVPLFKEQIAAGGPVMVTHPEVRRYFMTIPEAAQLVLQAFALGKGGEVFVLEMGDPVKIVDLATNLILLSGLRPGEDIEIRYTGLRPGEKLYEELQLMDESMRTTVHPKIRIYCGNLLFGEAQMDAIISRLRQITEHRDLSRLVLLLKELIPDYNPGAHILKAAMITDETAMEKVPLVEHRLRSHSDDLEPRVRM